MNEFPEFARMDEVSDAERRLRTLHEVMREATATNTSDSDLQAIFADAERAATPSVQRGHINAVTRFQPRQRVIFACDIEGSTSRTNPVKAAVRIDMYDLLEAALLDCNITEDLREPFINTGDGVIMLVRPVDGLPKTHLLNSFVPVLSDMLAEHGMIHPKRKFRLRVAIHSGEVHFDRQGTFGEDIDLTFRLLNSPEFKQRLTGTDAPLVLAVSDHIHRSVIRHGYDGIDGQSFEPLIGIEMAGQRHTGWVQVPAEVRGRYDRHGDAHADRTA